MKVWQKVLIAPAVAIACLLAFGVATVKMTASNDRALKRMNVQRDRLNALSHLQDKINEAHAGVYRLFVWIENLDDAKQKAAMTSINGTIGQARTRIQEITASGAEADQDSLQSLSKSIDVYAKQVGDAIDMATVDKNTGMASMQSADQTYQQMKKVLGAAIETQMVTMRGLDQQMVAALHTQTYIGVALTIAALVLVGLSSVIVTRRITGPLRQVRTSAQALAQGDLNMDNGERSSDEVGDVMRAFDEARRQLSSLVWRIRESSESISTASSEIAQGNIDLSSRTEQQAFSLEKTASSMEELTSKVRQNAHNARQANQLVLGASESAVRGGATVKKVVLTMNEIAESSKRIQDIITVIDGIAFQTNILALNAAVEAARAGSQGRGFAVVASEVRNLAQRSAAAAKEIKQLITESVAKVDSGGVLVNQAGVQMEEIVAAVARITDITAEISSASAEQSSGIEAVNSAVTQMDQMTQQNAALVEEAAAAAQSMRDQAGQLITAVSAFKLSAHAQGAGRDVSDAPVEVRDDEPAGYTAADSGAYGADTPFRKVANA
jgi:methyl-accepting chemotaxis protein